MWTEGRTSALNVKWKISVSAGLRKRKVLESSFIKNPMETQTRSEGDYNPLVRYERLIKRRNRKVAKGIQLIKINKK